MFVARVTGSVVATQKVASMTGHKLLTVEPYRVDETARDRLVPTGRTFVVVDALGAGNLGVQVVLLRDPAERLQLLGRDLAAGDARHHRVGAAALNVGEEAVVGVLDG